MRCLYVGLLLVSFSMLCHAESADAIFQQAVAKGRHEDYQGALADINRALALAPANPEYLYGRALTESQLDLQDEALTDINNVLESTKNPAVLCARGRIKLFRGDLRGGQEDIEEGCRTSTPSGESFTAMAYLHLIQGDTDDALSEINQALDLKPDFGGGYSQRAEIKYQNLDLDGAVADLQESLRLEPAGASNRFLLWFIFSQQGHPAEANAQITKWVTPGIVGYPVEWHLKVDRFLLGQMSETELLAAAPSPNPYRDKGQHCEAYYYIGAKHLLAGDKPGAIANFKKSIATNKIAWVEYILSRAELKKLSGEP